MNGEDKILWTRVFDKFDTIDKKVDNLCERATRTETTLKTHLENQEKRAAKKEKIFYVVIAAIGASIGIFEYIK